ncbi:MAG: ABC transporter permease [Candidatus Lokiarchaeota archaeon]|nr:ABC transporter permease [Candidatus Lokiarchaeota archaeon]MBD3338811.1 ABC transporter permease [Candidatus Lokiarchaeota archaeon]
MCKELTQGEILIDQSSLDVLIEQFKRSLAICRKNLKIYYNKPPVVIQALFFPIVLLIAFTLGRNIQPVHIVSGLTAMTLFFSATSIGPVTFPFESRQKTLERIVTSPVSLKTLLMGDVWSSFLFGLIFTLVPLFFVVTVLNMWSYFNIILIVVAVIISCFALSCFSLIFSVPPADSPQDVMILTVLIKFTITFLSPLFMPIENHPISVVSPLTYFIDLVNLGFTGESAFGPFGVILDFTVLLVFAIFILFVSYKLHIKTLQKRFI